MTVFQWHLFRPLSVELISYFDENVLANGVVITDGPCAAQLLKDTNVEIPAKPNSVDVMYWKIKPEYRLQYKYSHLVYTSSMIIISKTNRKQFTWQPDGNIPIWSKSAFMAMQLINLIQIGAIRTSRVTAINMSK